MNFLSFLKTEIKKIVATVCLVAFIPVSAMASGSAAVLCIEADGCVQLEQAHENSFHDDHEGPAPSNLSLFGNTQEELDHFDFPLWISVQNIKSSTSKQSKLSSVKVPTWDAASFRKLNPAQGVLNLPPPTNPSLVALRTIVIVR